VAKAKFSKEMSQKNERDIGGQPEIAIWPPNRKWNYGGQHRNSNANSGIVDLGELDDNVPRQLR